MSEGVPSNLATVGVPGRVMKTGGSTYEKICAEFLHLYHLMSKVEDRAMVRWYGRAGDLKGISFGRSALLLPRAMWSGLGNPL